MRISRLTHASQQRSAWPEAGFATVRPFSWGRLGRTLPKLPGRPVRQLELSKKRWGFFPLEIRKGWRELPKAIRFMVIAISGVHLTLFALWAYYKLNGQ